MIRSLFAPWLPSLDAVVEEIRDEYRAVLRNRDGDSVVELSIAGADGAPLPPGYARGENGDVSVFTTRHPKAGYWFRAMRCDHSTVPSESYAQVTDGRAGLGPVHHPSRFGFCAYPARYGESGKLTFILNQRHAMYQKDTGGRPVLTWPSYEELFTEWSLVD